MGLTDDERASRIAFNATQSLLRGFGPAVNLASVNQAKIDTQISQYELRGFAQTLVAQVEQTYWDYALAERRIEIFNQSLDLAQKQLEETRERIRVGDLAATELVGRRGGGGPAPRESHQRPQRPGEDQADSAASGQPARRQSLGPGGRACQPANDPFHHA